MSYLPESLPDDLVRVLVQYKTVASWQVQQVRVLPDQADPASIKSSIPASTTAAIHQLRCTHAQQCIMLAARSKPRQQLSCECQSARMGSWQLVSAPATLC